jgi:hypothetical protein
MRTLAALALVVTISQFIEVETTVWSAAVAQDRVAEILKEARKALGGDDKVAAVKTLSAEGPYRRAMGPQGMEGTLTLIIGRPDKLRRAEELSPGGMINGPVIERTSVLNGNAAWDDSSNRGMGGGMQIVIRDGPGPGAPPPPPPPGGGAVVMQGPAQQMTPEQLNEARVRRMRVALQRWMAALFAEAPTPFVDGGIAESPEGKADILESKDDTGRTLRLFIDQQTHLPLMVQYQHPKPMIISNVRGGPGGGPGAGPGRGGPGGGGAPMTPEEKEAMQKRIDEMRKQGPQMGTWAIHVSDYKKVGSVMLPHKIDVSVDGEPSEEWTVEKYQINPNLKASDWEQPKK